MDDYLTRFRYSIVADDDGGGQGDDGEAGDGEDDEGGGQEPRRPHPRQTIGTILAYYFDGDGAEVPGGVWGRQPMNALVVAADATEQDVYEMAGALYRKGTEPLTRLGAARDTIYISWVSIQEPWQGHDIGLFAAEVVIQDHGRRANVALIAMAPELDRYWRRLGLVLLPRQLHEQRGGGRFLWHNAGNPRRRFRVPG